MRVWDREGSVCELQSQREGRVGKLPTYYSQCWWKDHWCKSPTRRADRHPCQWNASPVHQHLLEEQEHQTGVTTRSDINLSSQTPFEMLQKLMHGRTREWGTKGNPRWLDTTSHDYRNFGLFVCTLIKFWCCIATIQGNYLPSRVDQPTYIAMIK